MKESRYSLYNYEPVIRTYSGLYMNPFEPNPELILIEDIAHALSNQCRFGGHLPNFYSVAQHSIKTSECVEEKHQLSALLHDASEAYLIDVPRPVKNKLQNYKEIEHGIMTVIAEKFGFEWPLSEEVKRADEYMLNWEWDNLMISETPLSGWNNSQSKKIFLSKFYKLTTK